MTWAVVGAGYTGIAVAGALLRSGTEVDVLDARGTTGGLWVDGTYGSVRLITSRDVTAYPGRPLPPGPLFPTGPELLAYLQETARATGVADRLQHRRVSSVVPDGDGWSVDGTRYDGVVLATGMFTAPRVPDLPGELGVPQLHTSSYKDVGQLGDDVLVVGLGNSGADVAQDCVKAGKRVRLAVGRSRHVVPKRVLGVPVVRAKRPAAVPDLAVRVVTDLVVRGASQWWRRGVLPQPRHLLLSESPVVHSALLPLVAKGSIEVVAPVTALDGASVHLADGTVLSPDTVVWATGYDYDLPVDRALLDGGPAAWGSPLSLVGGAWSPVSPGLAAVGHREPRHGRGPYLAALGELVAAGAQAQPHVTGPVGRALGAPTATHLVDDVAELPRLARMTDAARALAGVHA